MACVAAGLGISDLIKESDTRHPVLAMGAAWGALWLAYNLIPWLVFGAPARGWPAVVLVGNVVVIGAAAVGYGYSLQRHRPLARVDRSNALVPGASAPAIPQPAATHTRHAATSAEDSGGSRPDAPPAPH